MKILAAVFVVLIGGASALVIGMNWRLFVASLRAKPGERTPSMIPFVGGLLGGGGVLLAAKFASFAAHERPGWAWTAWLPVLLDPGCYLLPLALMPLLPRARAERGKDERG